MNVSSACALRAPCAALPARPRPQRAIFAPAATVRRVTMCAASNERQAVGCEEATWMTLATWAVNLSAPAAATAADAAAYNPAGGSEVLQNLAGVVYVGIVVVFFSRLFSKRAKLFTSNRIGSSTDEDEEKAMYVQEDEEPEVPVNVTPIKAFIGAGQAFLICTVLFGFCNGVDSFFTDAPIPDQYTARNITLSIQTIVRGLSYLLCFLFGANSLGMFALGMGLIINPDGVDRAPSKPKPKSDIPSVSLTSDPDDVRRAFEEATRVSKKELETTQR